MGRLVDTCSEDLSLGYNSEEYVCMRRLVEDHPVVEAELHTADLPAEDNHLVVEMGIDLVGPVMTQFVSKFPTWISMDLISEPPT